MQTTNPLELFRGQMNSENWSDLYVLTVLQDSTGRHALAELNRKIKLCAASIFELVDGTEVPSAQFKAICGIKNIAYRDSILRRLYFELNARSLNTPD